MNDLDSPIHERIRDSLTDSPSPPLRRRILLDDELPVQACQPGVGDSDSGVGQSPAREDGSLRLVAQSKEKRICIAAIMNTRIDPLIGLWLPGRRA